MSEMSQWTFEEWASKCPPGDSAMIDEPIELDSCFVRISNTAPGGGVSAREEWNWTSDPNVLLAFVKNVVVPDFIAWWFLEQEEDDDRLGDSRHYLDIARHSDFRREDIPAVEQVVALVDRIDGTGSRGEILGGLRSVSESINEVFSRPGTWGMNMRVFSDLMEAAEGIWEVHGDDEPPVHVSEARPLTRAEWLQMCREISFNTEAQEFVVQYFMADFW